MSSASPTVLLDHHAVADGSSRAKVIAAVGDQRQPALACFEHVATRTAWLVLLTSAVTATADRMIHLDARSDTAARAGVAATSVDASHAVAGNESGVVTEAIRRAVGVVVPA